MYKQLWCFQHRDRGEIGQSTSSPVKGMMKPGFNSNPQAYCGVITELTIVYSTNLVDARHALTGAT